VAVLFGGFGAAGSLLRRRLDLPDRCWCCRAAFVILAAEALRGRIAAGHRPVPALPVAPALKETTP
jgi:simple sugar transport system permease protein